MPKISEMFAFITEDNQPDPGGEGVIGFSPDGKSWMPMVGADMSRIKSLLPYALDIKKRTGVDFRVIRFSLRKDITEEVMNEYSP